MRKFKKLTSAVVSLMMVCTSMEGFTLWSSADDENVTLDLTSVKSLSLSTNNNGKTTYTLNGVTKIYTGQIILENGTLENGFTVESGTHAIVLNGVTINDSVVIKKNATASIDIEGINKVTAKVKKGLIDDTGKAGINVPVGATLNLSGNGTLTTIGSRDNDAFWENGGAGIGGNNKENAGTINISGNVTVNAQGNYFSAGIGCGHRGSNGGNITISGGIVNAYGGCDAAGIGGGFDGDGGNITISGGTVNAHGAGWAAGIGGGYDGNSGNIKITGGIVKAKGGENGAGIGGGNGLNDSGFYNLDGKCENITIDNSEVIAIAGKNAEPIGGGADELYTGKVIINGKELNKETRQKYNDWKNIVINTKGEVNTKINIKKYLKENLEICKYEDTKDIDVGNFKVIKQIDGKCYISYGDNNTGNEWPQKQLSGGIDYTGNESPCGLMLKPGDYTVVLDLDKNYLGKEICMFNKKTVIRLHGVTEEEFLENVHFKLNVYAISGLEFIEVQE